MIPEKLHHCQRSKKWFTWHVISIIPENKWHAHHKIPFAYNESFQLLAIAVLLIKIPIFFQPLVSVHLLQLSNQCFQAIRIRGPTCFRKALNLIFLKLSSQNICGFDRALILSPSFNGLRKEGLAQWPPFCALNLTKKCVADYESDCLCMQD